MTPLVAYYRVSTQRQGESGLGLEAQAAAVGDYARRHGGAVVQSYTEVESGRRCDRPELAKALAAARALRAIVCVAKLDRLARNVAFLSALMDAGTEFVACDLPHANRLTIHILAAVAEDEAIRIGQRVKDALAAYKARGGVLGTRDPRCRKVATREQAARASVAARAANRQRTTAYRLAIIPVIAELRAGGMTLAETAAELDRRGYRTRRGRKWTLANTHRVLSESHDLIAMLEAHV